MKRSFLSRFLEEEEEEPVPKDRVDRIKNARFQFMERIFGICDADPKKGREASNVIHPQSPFATGPLHCPPLCQHILARQVRRTAEASAAEAATARGGSALRTGGDSDSRAAKKRRGRRADAGRGQG